MLDFKNVKLFLILFFEFYQEINLCLLDPLSPKYLCTMHIFRLENVVSDWIYKTIIVGFVHSSL